MNNVTQAAGLPLLQRRTLIPYAGKEPAKTVAAGSSASPKISSGPLKLAAGTIINGIDCGGMTDDPRLGVPVYLQPQNRKPLTPEQQATFDAKMKAVKAAEKSALAATKQDPSALGMSPLDMRKSGAKLKSEAKAARKQAAATAKKQAKASKPKPAAKAKGDGKPKAKGPTIGGVANAAILAGKSNEEALAAVMKAFPECRSNLSCISWYRGKLREQGLLKGAAAAPSPRAAKAAPARAAVKKSAKARPTKKAKAKRKS